MKKAIACLALFLIGFAPAFAADKAKTSKDQAQIQKNEEDRRKKVDEKINEINETEWKVQVIPDHPKLKPVEDVLAFRAHTVQLGYFEKKGFQPTNYTVTVEEGEDAGNFETMKTHPEGGGRVVFIRGQWNGNRVSGVATERDPSDKEYPTIRYTFVGAKGSLEAKAPDLKKEEKFSGATDSAKILKSK